MASSSEVNRLEIANEQIAALQQDLNNVRRQERYATSVARMAASLTSQRSLPLTLTALAEEIVQSDEVVGVQVLLHEPVSGKLHMLGTAGFPSSQSSSFYAKLKECERLSADLQMLNAFRLSEPIVLANRYEKVMSDPAWAPLHDYHRSPRWDAFASIPIIVRGATVGILNAFVAPGFEVDEWSYGFLRSMAEQAAFAIDYSSLLEDERQAAQRQERQRLARDLHDSVVQQVFSIGMLSQTVSILAQNGDRDVLGKISDVSRDLEEITGLVLKDLRMLVAQLKPTVVDEGGLREALGRLEATTHRQTGVDIRLSIPHVVDDLVREFAEDLYHVIAEAMHNAIKHTSANQVDITVTHDDLLRVTIADNGAAMAHRTDPEHESSIVDGTLSGNGVSIMRERVEQWQGELFVDFQAAQGATVSVVVPLHVRNSVGDNASE